MKKENRAKSDFGEPTVRITRARAAAYQQHGAMPSREQSKEQYQKEVTGPILKRAALDERDGKAALMACTRNKKRAVLKNITNVCCENPYKKRVNASKIPVCILCSAYLYSYLKLLQYSKCFPHALDFSMHFYLLTS